MGKIKVVWICAFSNSDIRFRLHKKINPLEPFLTKIVKRKYDPGSDSGVWITNGINEIKSRDDVELHIITPYRDLATKVQEFSVDGIYYHFFRDENSGLFHKVIRYIFTRNSCQFKINRKRIRQLISKIKPDVIHVIGAENPFYSLALLDIPKSIPCILQLQALLISLTGKVPEERVANFTYKGEIEIRLIQRADYIGTKAQPFIDYIKKNVKPDVMIVDTTLAMAQIINLNDEKKEYTFVHFASALSTTKASDIALKAFIKVHRSHPSITLNMIGNYSDDFKAILDKMIENNNINDSVFFSGRLPTHEDVIHQIRKASFALLPIKTDIVPNTLHEAMANGLPLLTTETEEGTTELNKKRESVLISKIGDVDGLAENMIYILDHPDKAEELRQNAAITESEHDNNHNIINHWVDVYKAIIDKQRTEKEIPKEYLL